MPRTEVRTSGFAFPSVKWACLLLIFEVRGVSQLLHHTELPGERV